MSEWISVKDKLPDKQQVVLMYIPVNCYGCGQVVIGWLSPNDNTEWYAPDNSVYYLLKDDLNCSDVTHWMALPQVPGESK